jgi:hypothetical protein
LASNRGGCDATLVGPQDAAARLGITGNTARGYVKSLYGKLGVHNQLVLLSVDRRRGLLTEVDDPKPRTERTRLSPAG